MRKKVKSMLKNQKGFTLVELLAVIVILGIIAAIAIPSIGGIINNSKKDAHVANAQQMVSAAKMAVAADSSLLPSTTAEKKYLPLEVLENEGYLETLKDPDGGLTSTDGYVRGSYTIATIPSSAPAVSFVLIEKTSDAQYEYRVYLKGSKRHIGSTSDPVLSTTLQRSDVTDN